MENAEGKEETKDISKMISFFKQNVLSIYIEKIWKSTYKSLGINVLFSHFHLYFLKHTCPASAVSC